MRKSHPDGFLDTTGCAPVHTAFDGRETDAWLAFDVEMPKDGPTKYGSSSKAGVFNHAA
jgi:hypothetical protein